MENGEMKTENGYWMDISELATIVESIRRKILEDKIKIDTNLRTG